MELVGHMDSPEGSNIFYLKITSFKRKFRAFMECSDTKGVVHIEFGVMYLFHAHISYLLLINWIKHHLLHLLCMMPGVYQFTTHLHTALKLDLEQMSNDSPQSEESTTLRNTTVSDKLGCLLINMSVGNL